VEERVGDVRERESGRTWVRHGESGKEEDGLNILWVFS